MVTLCVNGFGEATVLAQQSDAELLRRIKTVDWPRAYREQDAGLLDKILAEEFERIGDDERRWSTCDETCANRCA